MARVKLVEGQLYLRFVLLLPSCMLPEQGRACDFEQTYRANLAGTTSTRAKKQKPLSLNRNDLYAATNER